MKGIIYENALKFKADVFKLIGIAFCTPAAAMILKGFVDKDLLLVFISWEMLIAIPISFVGIWVLDLAYKILFWLDEVKCNHVD
jgi:hypothetical protein